MKIKKAVIPGVALAVALVLVFSVAAVSDDWAIDKDAEMEKWEFQPEGGTLSDNSVNHILFEEYGPILLMLALLMFGSIIGGVYISKEDDEDDSG